MKLTIKLLLAAGLAFLASEMTNHKIVPTVQAEELRLGHFTSPRHPMHRMIFAPWGKELAEKSDGSLTMKIFPGGALGKGAQAQFKRAAEGVADLTWGLQGYTSAQFPRTLLSEIPGLAPDSVTATKMIWNAMELLKPEYSRIKVIGVWTSDPVIIMTKKKAIRNINDLKGLTMRAPSKLMGGYLKALGSTPVTNLPGPRIYPAFDRGVVDGVMTGASTIRSLKIYEIAKFYTLAPLSQNAMFLVMNKKKFDGLSAAHKKLVNTTSGIGLSVRAAKAYAGAGKKSLAFVKKKGSGEIIKISGAEEAKWKEVLKPLRKQTIDAAEAKGIPARKIVAAMEAAL